MRALTDATANLLKPIKLKDADRLELSIDKELKKFRARIFAEKVNGHNEWPSFAAKNEWTCRIPERKQLDGMDVWELAATDYTVEVVNACWPREKIVFADQATQTIFDYLLVSTTVQDGVAEVVAQFKETGKLPDGYDLEEHEDESLRPKPYQKVAAWCLTRSEGYQLLMEQGTGKTLSTIVAMCNLAKTIREEQNRMMRVLIVCPKNVRLNWSREIARFTTRPGKVEVIRGGFIKRCTKIIETLVPEDDCDFAACIMSYEGATRSWDILGNVEWDLVVTDEGHYMKRPTTSRSQFGRKIRDKAIRRVTLTGTPVSNTPLDLYALFEFIGDGWSGFKSWQAFKEFYGVFEPTEGAGSHEKLVGVQNLAFMKERLARTAFIISKKEAMPWLPDKTYDVLESDMSTEQQNAYEKVASELLLQIEDELDKSNNKSLTINNILTQLLRLAQIACGFIVWDEVVDPNTLEVLQPGKLEYFKENPKLDVLVETLQERPKNEKTIVWSCFVPALKQISERLTKEGIKHVMYYGGSSDEEREHAEWAFNNDPEMRVFVSNQAAGGTGLNLLGYPPHEGEGHDTDCTQHIYYACNWSYIQRSQSEDRSHRMGTRKSVRITDLVVPETIDEDIRIKVMKKKMMAMEVADIREILKAVLSGLGREKDE